MTCGERDSTWWLLRALQEIRGRRLDPGDPALLWTVSRPIQEGPGALHKVLSPPPAPLYSSSAAALSVQVCPWCPPWAPVASYCLRPNTVSLPHSSTIRRLIPQWAPIEPFVARYRRALPIKNNDSPSFTPFLQPCSPSFPTPPRARRLQALYAGYSPPFLTHLLPCTAPTFVFLPGTSFPWTREAKPRGYFSQIHARMIAYTSLILLRNLAIHRERIAPPQKHVGKRCDRFFVSQVCPRKRTHPRGARPGEGLSGILAAWPLRFARQQRRSERRFVSSVVPHHGARSQPTSRGPQPTPTSTDVPLFCRTKETILLAYYANNYW